MSETWLQVGVIDVVRLADARKQAHWAVQLVSASADAVLAHESDDSHTTMTWRESAGALVGRQLSGAQRVGLQCAGLSMLTLNDDDTVVDKLDLHGETVDSARKWLRRVLQSDVAATAELNLRGYDMPDHRVAAGAAFDSTDREAFAELARWFANGTAALEAVAARDPTSTDVSVWPHHFDIGAILFIKSRAARDAITSDQAAAGQTTPDQPSPTDGAQIGYGLSPGDAHFDEPYFYVTPWPVDATASLPELPLGYWHQGTFTGAVLTATEVAALETAERQQTCARAFLNAAITASYRIAASG